MQNLKITESAYKVIKEESFKCETETGGLLIGTLNNPIVLKASKSGPQAKVTHISYANDTDYDNQVLQQAINDTNGKCKLIGFWHKHPLGLTCPSTGDFIQAKQIIKRNELEGDNRPVFFIISNVEQEIKLYIYSLAPHQKDFYQMTVEIISDAAKEIKEALQKESIVIQPRELDFWKGHFQFYLTEFGYERLKQEINSLVKYGYKAKIYLTKQLCIKIQKAETILCYPPPEYPLNPPRFFKGNNEIEYSLPIWNSTYKIVDILQKLNIQKLEGEKNESNNTQTNFRRNNFIPKTKNAIKSLWYNARTRRFSLRFKHRPK